MSALSFANLLSRLEGVVKFGFPNFPFLFFVAFQNTRPQFLGFSAPFQLVQVHLQQLDPEGTVEVEQNAPAPRSHLPLKNLWKIGWIGSVGYALII